MEKRRYRIKNIRILPSFVLIMLVFLILGMLLTEVETTLLHDAQMQIAFQYSDRVTGYDESRVWRENEVFDMTPQDSKNMQILQIGMDLLPVVSYLACAMLAGLLFYRMKIKKPLQLLGEAIQNISRKNLDFHITYEKNDEMGALCQAFETMRKALEENNQEMWRQVNERKWMNASFSHDMKTPLTIMEGNLEMLQKYSDNGMMTAEDIKEAYAIMEAQIVRIGNYITSMNTLAQIGDISIEKKMISLSNLIETLHENAKAIVTEKELIFHDNVGSGEMLLDQGIVLRIYENLLSNAIRFAQNQIEVTIEHDNNGLMICVEDDGLGFDEKSLERATEAFYSTEKKGQTPHLGLGLNIVKVLCERHGGSVSLRNGSKGAKIEVFLNS